MSTYLSICPTESIQQREGVFTALICPKNYQDWQTVEPDVLLLEGIHQFSVRIFMLSLFGNDPHKMRQHQGHILPSQDKNLIWHHPPTYATHHIQGHLDPQGQHALVSLKAYRANLLITEGQVIVSQI